VQNIQRPSPKLPLAFAAIIRVEAGEQADLVVVLNTAHLRPLQEVYGLGAEAIVTDRIPSAQHPIHQWPVCQCTAQGCGSRMNVGDGADFPRRSGMGRR
jgi:hypothetical protein